jgi:aminoglycoside phosphotransferase (APT) family kinase protein
LIARPDTQLVVHHPERRAVVCLRGSDGVRYAKVVRTTRVAELADIMRTLRALAGAHFATPEVLEVQEEQGVIMLSALAGASLYELRNSDSVIAAASDAGAVLHQLHRLSPPNVAVKHTAEDEMRVLQRWLDRLAIVVPKLFQLATQRCDAVFAALVHGCSPPVLLHRDFYDKQVFFAPGSSPGLLDFDTLAVGEAALDLANGSARRLHTSNGSGGCLLFELSNRPGVPAASTSLCRCHAFTPGLCIRLPASRSTLQPDAA